MNQAIIQLGLTQVGIKETVGKQDNPEVLKYFKKMGFGSLKDETAWCSAFMNWIALNLGLEHSNKLTARSWLDVGEYVGTPVMGDIVIFWRETKKPER